MRSPRNVLLLVLGLTLAACNTVQPPTRSSSGRSVVGMYELNVQGGSSLAGQALSATDQPLSFQRLSVTTINDSSQTGQQYVHSLYRVTNTSSVPLTNLTFLPTSTQEDSDPATTASVAPTIAGTEFKQISYFDGSDASDKATALRAEQARMQVTQGVSSPQVQSDPNATTFRVNLSVQGLTPTAPVGLVATVKPYGWLLSGTLQPGASVTLDLGASVPLGAQNPFAYNIVLTVAEDDSSFASTPVSATVQEQSASDPTNTPVPWSGGAATVEAQGGDYLGNGNSYRFASGTVDASGHLALNLASDREMVGLGGGYPGSPTQTARNGCTSTVTSTDARLNTTGFEYLQAQTSSGQVTIFPAENLNAATMSGIGGLVIYADRPATLNGTLTCSGSTKVFSTVALIKGWNLLREDVVKANATISNGAFPKGWLVAK